MRENLSLVSTVIATKTFQALINPPGGFIQQGLSSPKDNSTSSNEVLDNVTSSSDLLNCTILHDNNTYCPGQAMASYSLFHPDFENYLFYVTISFISSLSITLLLVSGIFPMKNKAVIWMLSIGMCITLTSLAAPYFTAMNIIIPSHLLYEDLIWNMKIIAYYAVSCGLFGLILWLVQMSFFVWVNKKSKICRRKIGCHVLLWLFWILAFLISLYVPSNIFKLTFRIFVT